MMARLTFLAAAALLVPAASIAQTPQSGGGRLELVGEAPSACVIRGPSAVNAVNATVEETGSDSSRIRIVQMVDNASAEARPVAVDLSLPIICNSPHRLTVRTANGGLLRAGAPAPTPQVGFVEFLPYQLQANWAGQEVRGGSRAGLGIDSASGRAGQMTLSVNVPPGGPRLAFGTYSDDIIIEFQAAN